ncbi:MAG: restriction endonuclease, partial [Clostridiales bacterium]|nr:restriction endonuclease [Clostridiales bacterium]
MAQEFFIQRPAVTPTIYAYKLVGVNSHKGYIKVGYTDRDVETRVKEQLHTSGIEYKILLKESAMRSDGTCFTDHEIHTALKRKGFLQLNQGLDKNEWFNCTIKDVISAINYVRDGISTEENRTLTFKMRPEQTRAVQKTIEFFDKAKADEPEKAPKFLWNAKMRFGKTFASYQLAKKLNFKRVLVLTFKPAVESAWREDLVSHVDFEGWQFISNKDAHDNKINIDVQFASADKSRPIVVFGSFQDLLGTNENGGIKAKNEFIHTTQWDLVIFDEYHFGAWRENAKKLFENPDEEENADFDMEHYKQTEADNAYNETFLPITTSYYLFLSGTPFRAINSGEFIEDQIYNWTYSDEQNAKESWLGANNPYLSLPRMVMLTYRIPESIRQIALQGEYDEFDLNVFFSAKGKGEEAKFTYENEVQKWLDLIRGSYLPSSVDDLKLGQDKRPPMPFSDTRLLNVLSHTLWFLPNVASCFAMANL